MGRKIVIRGLQSDGAIDFEQRLPDLIRLFHEPDQHAVQPFFGGFEALNKGRVRHEARAGVRPRI
jgi:hypothetical protein